MFSWSLPQRPSLVTVVEWIDYETLALLFGMVRLADTPVSVDGLYMAHTAHKDNIK